MLDHASPSVTWPSPAITTLPSRRTQNRSRTYQSLSIHGAQFLIIAAGYETPGRRSCLRSDSAYHGIGDWPHLGLPFEPRNNGRIGRRQPLPCKRIPSLCCGPSAGSLGGSGCPVYDRQRQDRLRRALPGGYSLLACLVAKMVLTLFFVLILMGVTDNRALQGFAPVASAWG